MKRSARELLGWLDRPKLFHPGAREYRLLRAQETIEKIKRVYQGEFLLFEYQRERICGRFITALEGEIAGTYTVVLKISSSRICSGPCGVRLGGKLVDGIISTGAGGFVEITVRAEI